MASFGCSVFVVVCLLMWAVVCGLFGVSGGGWGFVCSNGVVLACFVYVSQSGA